MGQAPDMDGNRARIRPEQVFEDIKDILAGGKGEGGGPRRVAVSVGVGMGLKLLVRVEVILGVKVWAVVHEGG